jgi:hypothetical protein
VEFHCDQLALQPGMYHANVCVKERVASEAINWQYQAATLRVDPGKVTRGQFYQANSWRITHAAPASPLPETSASAIGASVEGRHHSTLAPSS